MKDFFLQNVKFVLIRLYKGIHYFRFQFFFSHCVNDKFSHKTEEKQRNKNQKSKNKTFSIFHFLVENNKRMFGKYQENLFLPSFCFIFWKEIFGNEKNLDYVISYDYFFQTCFNPIFALTLFCRVLRNSFLILFAKCTFIIFKYN